MKKNCSPELARRIVDLLLNDPGVASGCGFMSIAPGRPKPAPIGEKICLGCRQPFKPSAYGRQYCSVGCFEDHRRQQLAPRKKPDGRGFYTPPEIRDYILERPNVRMRVLVDEIQERFGRTISDSTICRIRADAR